MFPLYKLKQRSLKNKSFPFNKSSKSAKIVSNSAIKKEEISTMQTDPASPIEPAFSIDTFEVNEEELAKKIKHLKKIII